MTGEERCEAHEDGRVGPTPADGASRPSRRVESTQTGPHPRLEETVCRHLLHPSRRPIAEHTRAAWSQLRSVLAEAPERPIVLDSGCGTGASTHRLAHLHPAAWVLGVDRSARRLKLERGSVRRGPRVVLARAELGDLWRLMAADRVRLGVHYLLYPNPWPKKRHLIRRIHGDPAFPALIALGGRLEARSNWLFYLEELARAIRLATGASARPQRFVPGLAPLSPFERKYARSEHPLYRLQVCLGPPRRAGQVRGSTTR